MRGLPASNLGGAGQYLGRSGSLDAYPFHRSGRQPYNMHGATTAGSGYLHSPPMDYTWAFTRQVIYAEVLSTSSAIIVTADVALVAAAGLTATLRERAQYALATVSAAGLLATLRERMRSGLATVSAAGLSATVPTQITEKFRNRIWDPVLKNAATKWKGFGRDPK